ncbi:FHA domain-containing protein [Psychrobacter sp. T6-6]|uniref:FHA domain-containing protein n=1 Tax=Psychrobacter sp. T6-6 TaxID=3457452 RepID=UPI003FD31F88
MTNNTDNMTAATNTWQLNALTEALGDLTLTVSDSLSVGRGSDSDVVLGSKQVSRNHAVLSVLDGQLYVKDLDSSNGTFINDRRITGNESNVLQANDTLGFASFVFQVQASTTPEESTTLAPATEEEVTTETETTAGTVDEQSIANETIDQKSLDNRPVIDELVTEETSIKEQTNESPVAASNEPVVKQTGIEEILPSSNTEKVSSVDTDPTRAPDTTMDKTADPVTTPTTEDVVAESVSPEPVVKETGIEDVLSAADSTAPAQIEETSVEAGATSESTVPTTSEQSTVTNESASLVEQEPVVEQPVAHKETVIREERANQMEHDKTTKTELQEEADPEVLKAKQAASAQFSGTANLGQDRDLGTEGNNAMDQEISNPAHTGQVEKKASGGWFIWVFLAILIIGLALWLFNMGGV